MKLYNQGATPASVTSPVSFAGLIEKIEILRSTLRWSSRLDRPEIEKLLKQVTTLRDEVMGLSHKERFVQAASAEAAPPQEEVERMPRARRQALVERSFIFEGTFGDNPKLLEALEIAEKAAPTDLPVLIDGESGTGKELMAKVIHANGSRTDKPFISVNCGAIPDSLLESELFGHKKGAFTGASNDRRGKFESAHTGTIFLDEIGELPLTGQVKLLRVLEAHEIQRVGSDEAISVDTRIVAATNKDLRRMSQAGTFREDLFYRLSVIHVSLPSLRERRDEIPLLVSYFSDEAAGMLKRRPLKLTPRLRDFLLHYDYPGNIRELRNLMYRLSCLAGDTADLAQLPQDIRPRPAALAVVGNGPAAADIAMATSLSEAKRAASDEAERAFLERGLQEVGGTVAELARRFDMNRSHLQMLLKKHGIHSKDFRANRQAEGGKG
ncbi:FhlA-type transcriptional regulator [Cupriavidus necator]|uniref:Response regulator containing CheY-like receiver, AAA-type ATPase, and DNA-binding domains n=1 Tax=Cupriavidus necator (strain ATCC 17699 / DSM 428 / KCTC 22496 / NCIMB 10442 / H16 / Stanier 337) TaxID=381666 RepID=Q0K8A9_CUPNH|nr:sigma-54 dependent transcriptional regulator [Cupriavidus necator]QCC01542.1 sigma-54-dependent Fis family transcriptional regulator [Cupriavidus necator H16]QQB75627.1 sigma-54-dependent Fis family transcriptional regulator [Cupriavidus necator]WKA39932.1 sigma-54 dependent transcriptional regulator [Cupriavidus necator]CAJ93762.1 response regulator containing CheY-like receiver, AAA-type ATPase, and DNA-binding domains [Cupriavidus necator H16]